MTVHADGLGTSWDENSPDADRSVGLTYRSLQDLRKGVRIRGEKQHKTYGGSSCGGLHLPSKASVLLVDTTPNFAAYITGGTDPSCAEWGIAYDTSGYLWHVADNTLSFCALGLHPQSLCADASARMTGTWQWDASQIFNDPVDFSTVEIDGSCDISGTLTVDGTADFSKVVGFNSSVGCYSFVEIDGTAPNTGLLLDNSACISGKFHCGTNILFDRTVCDFSGTANATWRLPTAWGLCNTTAPGKVTGYNCSAFDASTIIGEGRYCFSFANTMNDTNYAVLLSFLNLDASSSAKMYSGVVIEKILSGFRCVVSDDAGTDICVSQVTAVVYGGQ